MRIHHIGIAVESLEEAVPVFELLLGAPPVSQESVGDQKARVAVFQVGESRIELLESTSPDSPVSRFISKRGPGIHHLTLAVEDLQGKLDDLEGRGFELIDRQPRPGAGEESVAFLHPSSTAGILIELLDAGGATQPQPRRKTGKE
jgi:methylmalonyl-CoA/ethylmalonyl-CoA epimerase